VKFREHRGGLDESMKTLVELPDRAALVAHIKKLLAPFDWWQDIGPALHVEPYAWFDKDKPVWDERVKWHTYIVTLEGYGVVGFTDGPA
jgi:hypothetical protein